MELKWLEDFVSVVETGHFARAADARNITQSAFSRRIKSLEIWAGTELLDRSQHPVSVTSAGENFLPRAKQIIQESYEARSEAISHSRIAETGITLASLHTLALFRIPALIAELRESVGKFEATIVAETRTVEEYLESLYNGSSDFFICYRHPSFPFDVDIEAFPRLDIGHDRVLPYAHRELYPIGDLSNDSQPISFLEYAGTSFLSRVVQQAKQKAPFLKQLRTVYRATLAESLCTAAINGLGVAWLPESVVTANPRGDALYCINHQCAEEMKVSAYSASSNQREVVRRIWAYLSQLNQPT